MLGITGGFGTGKTTVAGLFRLANAQLISADKIAHQIIRPGARVYKKIIRTFGQRILKKNKLIDRHKLARLAFNNKKALKKLNLITHPQIISIINKKIKTSRSGLVILDAPLLIEAGLANLVDALVVVKAQKKQQIARLLKKTALNKNDILERIKNQMPLEEKTALADFIIDNSGSIRNTKRQVKRILKEIKKVSV